MLEQNGSSQTKFTVAVVRPKGFPGWIWFALFFHQDKCFVLLIDAKISRASNHLFNSVRIASSKIRPESDQIQTVPQYRILVFPDPSKT